MAVKLCSWLVYTCYGRERQALMHVYTRYGRERQALMHVYTRYGRNVKH